MSLIREGSCQRVAESVIIQPVLCFHGYVFSARMPPAFALGWTVDAASLSSAG